MDLQVTDIQALLEQGGWNCGCGKQHQALPLRMYVRGKNALDSLPEVLTILHDSPCPQLVYDQNTYAAAQHRVATVLKKAGIPYHETLLPQDHPHPDEHTVGSILMGLHPESNILVAVGSGVLNDCCKLVAHAVGLPSAVVATAPSMDGYASNSSSMARDGIKVTLYNRSPDAIIADTALVATAPDAMLWAGLGDMLAKSVALCEWRISNLVTGEPFCETIAGMMRQALARVGHKAQGLAVRDSEALEAVMDGLVLSGLAMSYAQSSRPASGLEHQFSHVWDMSALEFGTPSHLHGIQVGVGTLICLRMYEVLTQMPPDLAQGEAFAAAFHQEGWERRVRRVFGRAADSLLLAAQREGRNDMNRRRARADTLARRWPDILAIIREELPKADETEQLMKSLGMPLRAKDLGISPTLAMDALLCSRDIRDKYTTSALLWDLGLLYREDLWGPCL